MAEKREHIRLPGAWSQYSFLMLALLFVVTRIIVLLMWQHPGANFIDRDVGYYGFHLHKLSQGAEDVMHEYPPPAVWILQLIYIVGQGWQTWKVYYIAAFVLLDAAVAATLYRTANWRGALFWILFTFANGPIVWFRFDLIPAALVAWACLFLVSHPKLSGALVGMGAAIKFWPALLIAPMMAPDPRRAPGRSRLIGFGVAGLGLAAISLAVEGWKRNVAPLEWQSERGLQIESVPATPLMWARTFTPRGDWTIKLSEYNALELFGPGVEFFLKVSTVLTAVAIIVTVVLTVRLIRNKAGTDAVLLAILTIVLAMIVSNKTLSPQYILWLGGPVAVLLLRYPLGRLGRHAKVLAVSMVVVGFLTQYTYPWGAYGIMRLPNGSGPETSVLVLRNIAVVVLFGYSFWLTWAQSRRRAPERSPLEAQVTTPGRVG